MFPFHTPHASLPVHFDKAFMGAVHLPLSVSLISISYFLPPDTNKLIMNYKPLFFHGRGMLWNLSSGFFDLLLRAAFSCT